MQGESPGTHEKVNQVKEFNQLNSVKVMTPSSNETRSNETKKLGNKKPNKNASGGSGGSEWDGHTSTVLERADGTAWAQNEAETVEGCSCCGRFTIGRCAITSIALAVGGGAGFLLYKMMEVAII